MDYNDNGYFLDYDVRALTIRQPFATLMLPPACKVETRTWNTTYRGWVLICAGQIRYKPWRLVQLCGEEQLQRMDSYLDGRDDEIKSSMGMAIGIGKLVDILPMTREHEDSCFLKCQPQTFCHIFSEVQPIHQFPWTGSLGYTALHDDTKNKIKIKFNTSL